MTEEKSSKLIQVSRNSRDIYGNEGQLWRLLCKAKSPDADKDAKDGTDRTNQGIAVGQRPHLIDKLAARELRDANTTHSACLDAKTSSTVGLGHRDEMIHEILDPLCQFSWQDTMDALADDYWETGECFLEVAKNNEKKPEEITGLFHLESAQTFIEVEEEDNSENYHYVVLGETGGSQTTVMAKWGDLARLKKDFLNPKDTTGNANDTKRKSALAGVPRNSEVIHIRQSRNRSRYLGFPDYMSAVPSIELVQCMTQHEFDFYFNRGVPEFLLFLIGSNINPETWKKIEDMLKAGQGLGNSHKTGGVHIPGSPEQTVVQIEKLAMEDSGQNGFSDKSLTLAMLIATAHGVPPMLANILLPGKIGAANEGPNALMIFQKRKLGQAQRNFSTMFARTLGSEGVTFAQPSGASKTLKADQFLGGSKQKESKPNPMDPQAAMGSTDENGMPIFAQPGNGFKTVLDGMTLGAQDTLARMKEPLASSTRNPEDGLLGGADDRKKSDPKKSR